MITFSINGTPVCDLGLDSARLSLRAGGPDRLELSYSTASGAGAPIYAVGAILTVVAVYSTEEGAVSTTLFVGRVVRTPSTDDSGATRQIVAENGWGDMRRCMVIQTWASRAPFTGALTTLTVSRALLGQADNGTPMHSGQILADIVARASGQGAMLSAGTISPSLPIAPTEVVDTSCDAAFRRILGYHPDHVAYIAGTAMHVRPSGALPVVSVDPCEAVVEIDPEDAEMPGGVVIVYERTHTYDGEERVERIVDSAGSAGGWPPPIRMTIPLRGSATTTKSQVIETRRIPPADDLDSETAKRFFSSLVPDLSGAASIDLRIRDLSVRFADAWQDDLNEQGQLRDSHQRQDSSQEDIGDYPRQLLSGEIQPWMPSAIRQYDAIVHAKVYYRGSDPEIRAYVGEGVEISEPITVTNALPRTYRATDSVESGETPPAGLAAAYWAEIAQPRTSGSASGALAPSSLLLRPGARATVDGRMATPQPVREASYDMLQTTYQARWGPSDYRDPKSVVDLARAAQRNPPTWRRTEERTQGAALGGSAAIREGARPVTRTGGPRSKRMGGEPWSLVAGAATGTYRVVAGTVSKGFLYDAASRIAVTNIAQDFQLAAGDLVWLELTRDLALTVESGPPEWEAWPYAVETELLQESGNLPVMKVLRYLLWQVSDSDDPPVGSVPLGDGMVVRRMAPAANLQVVPWVQEGSEARVVAAWMLVPGPGTVIAPS